MCDRVGVLYAGRLVEEGPVETVLQDPRHPYTVGLLRCIPRGGVRKDAGRLDTIPGFLPSLGAALAGCVFADRCALADDRCRSEEPALTVAAPRHIARCFYQEQAQRLPRQEAYELDTRRRRPRDGAPRRARRSRQGVPAAGPRHPRARRGQRCDLERRDARARRVSREAARRRSRAPCSESSPRARERVRARRANARAAVPEAQRRGSARSSRSSSRTRTRR